MEEKLIGFQTQQSTRGGVVKRTIYRPGWRSAKEKEDEEKRIEAEGFT